MSSFLLVTSSLTAVMTVSTIFLGILLFEKSKENRWLKKEWIRYEAAIGAARGFLHSVFKEKCDLLEKRVLADRARVVVASEGVKNHTFYPKDVEDFQAKLNRSLYDLKELIELAKGLIGLDLSIHYAHLLS